MDPYIYRLPPRVNYEEVENTTRPLKRSSKSYDLLDLEPLDKKYKNDINNINNINNIKNENNKDIKNINDFSYRLSNIEIFSECMCNECRK